MPNGICTLSHFQPGSGSSRATIPDRTAGITVVIIGNMFVSSYFDRRDVTWNSVFREFGAMMTVNGVLAALFILLEPGGSGSIGRGDLLFFLFLLTLIVLLYDAYRPMYRKRLEESRLRVVDDEPLLT